MKNIYALSVSALLIFVSFFSSAQTNVSGGIYSNTTWTKTNSPYIVTDTVVVFPGYTLTIEPGVVVKFADNKILEIREATLIAVGTKADSITFTSNSSSPMPEIWCGVYINMAANSASQFSYCNFRYALGGLQISGNVSTIKNSSFTYNFVGVGGYIQTDSAENLGANVLLIDSSNFDNNTQTGLCLSAGYVTNCSFTNNLYYGVFHGFGTGGDIVNSNFSGNRSGLASGGGDTLQNCNFDNNYNGVQIYSYGGSESIMSCTIMHNEYGVNGFDYEYDEYGYFTITNSKIDSNKVIGILSSGYDNIRSCEIKNNSTGIAITIYAIANIDSMEIVANIIEDNSVGIADSVTDASIYCNKICNNSSYNFIYGGAYTSNIHIANNYWCSTDSATIASGIYDGYNNINLGLAFFMPIDTAMCYLSGCNLQFSVSTISATCDSCHDGSASVQVINGVAPYTYTWYTSPIQTTQTATGVPPGTYTICVVDANKCSACFNGVQVKSSYCVGFAVSASASNASCLTCSDGSAWVNVAGGKAPYNYTWYTSPFQSTDTATGVPHGSYQVCVTDQYGCSACDSVTVGTGSCSAHFELFSDTIPHSYLAKNMASGVAPIQYVWTWGDGTSNSSAYPSHTYDSAGYYTICLTITDGAGCTNRYCVSYFLKSGNGTMIYITVVNPNDISTAINKAEMDNSFFVFPNPASNNLTLILPSSNSSTAMRIYNLLGEVVQSSFTNTQNTVIDISQLPSGAYIIEAISGESISRQKFVKE